MISLRGGAVGPAKLLVGRGRRGALAAGLAASLCAGAGLLSCNRGPQGEHDLAASRVYEPVGRNIRWNATAAERIGVSAKDFGGLPADAPPAAGGAGLHWQTPPGWKDRPASTFRDANFQVGDDPRAECYLTTLGGDGGGLESNINRWRSQMSLPPLSPAAIAALPRVPWLGGDAVSADFTGRWTGMSGDQGEDGWRLVGLVLMQPGRSRFLKLVGPAELVDRELPAFRELAASFHEGAEPADDALPPAAFASGGAGSPVTWRAPEGWERGADRPTREVTFFAGTGHAVECYVTLLGGDAGGVLANVNRWCTQLGAAPLGDSDLAGLQRVPTAGGEGLLVRIERGEHPTVADAPEQLEGVVCMLPDRALFVKLAGPRDAVAEQHAALLEFCRSLQVAR